MSPTYWSFPPLNTAELDHRGHIYKGPARGFSLRHTEIRRSRARVPTEQGKQGKCRDAIFPDFSGIPDFLKSKLLIKSSDPKLEISSKLLLFQC